jgi:hypothetical protein
MAIIRNIIETAFTARGAPSVVKQTEAVGRSQTRLGQSSAAAGRQFSAQADGLGGLVGAYAGAAATIFALSAAFNALKAAASAETIVKGTNALGAAVAQSGPQILAQLDSITQGQLTLAEAAQNANIALSAGFDSTQIEGLTTVALKASRALGRDLTDSVQRLVRGTSKLEPELLDELGIFVRLEPAVKAYARELGLNAKNLSQFERTQAFANAAIEEGLRKFASIDTTAPSAQKSLSQLEAQVKELAITMGQFLVNVLLPLVEFFKNDASRIVVLFGGILLLVFSKAIEGIKSFGASMVATVGGGLTTFSTYLEGLRGTYANLSAAQNKFADDVEKRGGLTPKGDQGNFRQKGVNAGLASKAAATRQRFLKGESMSLKQVAKDEAILTAIVGEGTFAQRKHGAAIAKTSLAYRDAQIQLAAYRKTLSNTSKTLGFATRSAALFAKGLRVVGVVASGVFKLFNWVFAIGAIFQVLGVDILGWVSSLFKGAEAAEQFGTGISGMVADAAGGSDQLTNSLKALGATEADLESVRDRIVEISSEVLSTSNSQKAPIVDAIEQASIALANLQQQQRDGASQTGDDVLISNLIAKIDADKLELDTVSQLTVAQEGLAASRLALLTVSEDERSSLLQTIELQKLVVDVVKDYDIEVSKLIGTIASASGLSSEQVSGIFGSDVVSGIDAASQAMTIFGITIRRTAEGTFDLLSLSDAQRSLIISSSLASNTLSEAFSAYDAGATDASRLSTAIGGINNQFLNSKDALASYAESLVSVNVDIVQAMALADQFFIKLEAQRDALVILRDALQEVETAYTGITQAFSSELGTLDTAQFSGIFSIAASGSLEIASAEEDILNNRLDILATTISTNAAAVATLATSNNNTKELALLNAQAELYDQAVKAVAGTLIDIIQSSQEITKEYKSINKELETQLDNQRQINTLALAALDNKLEELQIEGELNRLRSDFDIGTERLNTDQARLDILKDQLAATLDLSRAAAEEGGNSSIAGARQSAIAGEVTNIIARIDNQSVREAAEIYRAAIVTASEATTGNFVDAELAVIEAERTVKEAYTNAQIDMFDQETSLLLYEIQAKQAAIDADTEMLLATATLDKARIVAADLANIAAANIVKAQLEGYIAFASGVAGFGTAVDALSRIFQQFLEGLPGATGSVTATNVASSNPILAAQSAAGAAIEAVDVATRTQSRIAAEAFTQVNEIASREVKLNDERISQLTDESIAVANLREQKREQLELDIESGNVNAANAAANRKTTGEEIDGGDTELTALQEKLQSLFDSLKSSIQGLLEGFNDLILYGEGDWRDLMSGFFKGLQQDFFKTTISEPLSAKLSSTIFDSLGISGMGKTGSIEDAQVIGGALLVKLIEGPETAIAGLFTEGAKATEEKTVGFIENLLGEDGWLSSSFKTLFGSDGILSSMFSGLGSVLSSVFGGGGAGGGIASGIGSIIGSIFGGGTALAANGGSIMRKAQGGSVAGLRDRVPALMEPGEFVIRKPMVNKIGTNNLMSMNATGAMPEGGGAPTINITNEGTPKNAEASAPRFDGEKYVIDIMLRDFENNGPVRRSMRAGAV